MKSNKIISLGLKTVFQFSNKKTYHEPHPQKSVYKRDLPKMLIPLSSVTGKKLLKESIQTGYGQCFPTLIQQFITQQQPSTCGTATLAIILNALQVDPQQNWKGIWRWYDDYNIKGLTDHQIMQGITIKQWHQLAILNGLKSIYFHPKPIQLIPQHQQKQLKQQKIRFVSDSTIYQCIKACTRRSNFPMSINISRSTLEQTGSGHFGPIAAFHDQMKMVLFLDTAKFKYPLYWTPLSKVIQSLKPIDDVTKLPRGLILNKKRVQTRIQSIFCDWESDHSLNQRLHINIRNLRHSKGSNIILPQQLQFVFDQKVRNVLIPILFDLMSQTVSGVQNLQLKKQVQQQTLFKQYQQKYFPNREFSKTNNLLSQFCQSQRQKRIVQFILYTTINGASLTKELKGKQFLNYINKLRFYFDLENELC